MVDANPRRERRHPTTRIGERIAGFGGPVAERKRPFGRRGRREEQGGGGGGEAAAPLDGTDDRDDGNDAAIQGLMFSCSHRWNPGTVGLPLLLLRIILEAGGREVKKGQGSDQHPSERTVSSGGNSEVTGAAKRKTGETRGKGFYRKFRSILIEQRALIFPPQWAALAVPSRASGITEA